MADIKHLDQIAERVERLLLRHEELQRTNALLHEQIQALQAERDTLKSRLNAARARIDALLDRLPAGQGHADTTDPLADPSRQERA
jgi:chromosome segregation ATPase